VIELSALRKTYPSGKTHLGRQADVVALDGIDLHVPRGAIHGIVGRSGAGKSTLIRCLTVLERPTSGTVTVGGEVLSGLTERQLRGARRRIGMVFQHVNLLDSRTVAANVALPLEVARVPRAQRTARVAELLELVGLGDRARSYPAQLSGGQRQRVGIARALATEPDVLLCDEPTSALDSTTTRQILTLIRDLRDRLGITVLLITHEMAVVREICDSVTLLESGRVVEHGDLGRVASEHGTRLARELIPVPPLPVGDERSLLEVAFSTEDVPTHAVLTAVASLGSRVHVAAGTIETLGGLRVGRLRLDVPAPDVDRALEGLRAAGLYAEVTP
jgi:D-methionine transport system ATP-binding protein